MSQRRMQYRIYPFRREYMGDFGLYGNGMELDENTIARFLVEMVSNTFKYGQSDVIATVQANYRRRRVYLSVSDLGRGFLGPMLECMDESGNFHDIDSKNGALTRRGEDRENKRFP